VLRAAGFTVREVPVDYSAWPGARLGPAAGVVLFVLAIAVLPASHSGTVAGWLGALLAGAATVAAAAHWTIRFGTRQLPFARQTGWNLEAVRGTDPVVWLVAHLDSKGQRTSLAVRAAGVVALAVGWCGVGACWLAGLAGSPLVAGVVTAAVVAAGGAVPLILSAPVDRGAGALDNASGVAAVLDAAGKVPADAAVGVLLTTAEELALAGARGWVGERRERAVALNCDGVDDAGEVTLIVGRDPGGVLRTAARGVAEETGVPVRLRRHLPGVLLDAVAFSEAGWPAATVARGSWGSLRRVHTRGDILGRLRGSGIAAAARVLAALAVRLATGAEGRGHVDGASGRQLPAAGFPARD